MAVSLPKPKKRWISMPDPIAPTPRRVFEFSNRKSPSYVPRKPFSFVAYVRRTTWRSV
jgi:hypothetical protein